MTLTKREVARRLEAYKKGRNDEEDARLAGMSLKSWRWWRRDRGLSRKAVGCARCGRGTRTASMCSRCRAENRAARTRKWSRAPFREYVRSLDGLRVSLKYSVQKKGVHGGGFRWARGVLRTTHGRGRVRIGAVRVDHHVIPGTRIIDVYVDWKGEWACGCGCGEMLVLRYNPPHGPPFYKAGHLARKRGKAQPGTFQKGHPSWSKGLRGKAFLEAYDPEARTRLFEGLRKGHEKRSAEAKGSVDRRDGYVLVASGEYYHEYRYPRSGRVWKQRKMVPRARVVMAKVLGRPLRDDEIVAHLNAVRNDDRPENLAVLSVQDKPALRWGMSVKKLRGEALLEFVRSVRTRVTKTCPTCRKGFDVPGGQADRRTYCSKKCQHHAADKVTITKPARKAMVVQPESPGPSRVQVPARRSRPAGETAMSYPEATRARGRVLMRNPARGLRTQVSLRNPSTSEPVFCPTCGLLRIRDVCGCNVDRSKPAPVPRVWQHEDEP